MKDVMPQTGTVRFIGVRPQREAPVQSVASVEVDAKGLVGDRYEKAGGKRAVTLIQAEHLPVIEALSGTAVTPELLRRNIVVGGVNLIAFTTRRFRIGDVVLEGTGACDPCEKMEAALGPGGWNAMSGHGGINARVIRGGTISVGDVVELVISEG